MKKISEFLLRGKWLKKEEHIEKIKELIDKIKNCFDNGHFEDSCDCLIIEKYIDSYFEEVSE